MNKMQYSLRMLLSAVTLAAIGAALWIAKPSWQIGVVEALVLAWVPASAVLLSVHSSGKAKAFWTGVAAQCILATALITLVDSSVAGWVQFNYSNPSAFDGLRGFAGALAASFRQVLLAWAFAPVVGLLCVLTHWLIIRPPEAKR